ncbi:MAG TPA: hypothetical protein VF146_12030, partial [Bryobacteraceae bacterium]
KWKPNFTFNLGVRWELYRPPYEAQGKGLTAAGGAAGVFGISGTSFANGLFQPGALNGSPTVIENIGPGTAHSGVPFYNTDWNNFAPGVGFAWSLQNDKLSWLTGGKDRTVIRAGYGIGYERLPIYLTHNNSAFEPGLSEADSSFTATNLSNLTLPVRPLGAPLSPIPLTGSGSHVQPLYVYDPNLRIPYVQNYNFSIQRAITDSTSITISYVGSKGTKLARSIDTNETNIFENGFLNAFQIVQAGGDSPLMDKIFANLPVASAATAVTAAGNGSNYVRTNGTTLPFLANNNPGGLANFINTTTFGTNSVGGLVPHAGLPLNFFVANPQFSTAYLTGNFGNSTYNSLQLQVVRRFSHGLSADGSYVWSKALGEDEGDSSTLQGDYRTLRNMGLDKRLLSFNHTGVFKLNGIYELPVGRGLHFGRNMNGFLDAVIGGWQVGWIYNYYTGSPLTIWGQNTVNTFANPSAGTTSPGYTPNLVGSLPKAQATETGGYVTLFPSLVQIQDPSRAGLAGTLGKSSSLLAYTDKSGHPVLVNPAPGQLGNLPLGIFTAPPGNQLDLNLQKQFRITERFNFQLRATATNALNHTQFSAPPAPYTNLNINSPTFGRLTTDVGPRILVLQARFNF